MKAGKQVEVIRQYKKHPVYIPQNTQELYLLHLLSQKEIQLSNTSPLWASFLFSSVSTARVVTENENK